MSVTGTNISLTLRNVKGSELTYTELDNNQSSLKTGIENHSHNEFSLTTHNHTGTYEPANSNIQSHISSTSNPHSVTASQVGLGSVLNAEQEVVSAKGQALGYCPLDGSVKIAEMYLPDSVLGQVEYQGTWNATTNTPAIPAASSTNKGWYYIIAVSGNTTVDAISEWTIGDWIISNGATWNKVDNTDSVSSVFGRAGTIVANSGDYTASQVTNVPQGNIAAITVQAAINELDSEKAPVTHSHVEADLALTDITTNNASTVKHGFLPKTYANSVVLTDGTGVPAYLSSGATGGLPLVAQGGSYPTFSKLNIASGTNVTGILAVANGGTGSSTQNFVDLTTNQTVSGDKTFSNPVVVSAGTAALPALTTAGDTNTGVHFPAADTVGIATGGVERARITSSGYLIVNNTASVGAYPLQVTGASYFNGNIHTTGYLVWSFGTGSWQFRNSSKSTILEAIGNDGTGILYLRSGSDATSGSHVVIADVYSGNVLVGANNEHPNPAKTQISSPTLGLSVKADSADTARFWRPVNSVSATAGRILFGGYVDTSTYGDYASIGAIIENSALATKAGAIEFKTANAGTLTEKMRLTGDGKLQIGGTTAASYQTYIYNMNKFDTSLFISHLSSTTKTTYNLQLNSTFVESDNTTVTPVNLYAGQRVVVPNTVTKTGGYHSGILVNNLRNYTTVASGGDSGTAYELKGVFAQAGHFNSNASETPTTQLVKCFHATPYAITGTIANMYGLFIANQVGTAAVTNKWGVYQEDGNYKNYFAGEMRVGSITEILPYKLQVYTDTNSANGAVIKNASTGTSADVRFVLNNSNSTFQIIKYGANHSTCPSEVNIYQGGTSDVYITTNDTERIRIKGATGNLLVGTSTDPDYGAKIHSTAGISLGNSAVANGNVLDWYEEGTFTATATGMTTSPTGTVKYTRNGNIVVLDLPAISGTSNATTFTLTGMPSQLRPAAVKTVLLLVADNSGAAVYGKGTIGTGGILTIYKGPNGDAFTASGVKTVWAFSISYTLQ